MLDYIVNAYSQILLEVREDDVEGLTIPLKILQNFYFSNEGTIIHTIERVAFPLIKYMKKYHQNKDV